MQSRLYVNGREVRNPVVRGLATTLILGIAGLIFLVLAILFFSVIGVLVGIGMGIAGIGLGALAVRRAIDRRRRAELPTAEWHLIEERRPGTEREAE